MSSNKRSRDDLEDDFDACESSDEGSDEDVVDSDEDIVPTDDEEEESEVSDGEWKSDDFESDNEDDEDALPWILGSSLKRSKNINTYRAPPEYRGELVQCRECPSGLYIDEVGRIVVEKSGPLAYSLDGKRTCLLSADEQRDREERRRQLIEKDKLKRKKDTGSSDTRAKKKRAGYTKSRKDQNFVDGDVTGDDDEDYHFDDVVEEDDDDDESEIEDDEEEEEEDIVEELKKSASSFNHMQSLINKRKEKGIVYETLSKKLEKFNEDLEDIMQKQISRVEEFEHFKSEDPEYILDEKPHVSIEFQCLIVPEEKQCVRAIIPYEGDRNIVFSQSFNGKKFFGCYQLFKHFMDEHWKIPSELLAAYSRVCEDVSVYNKKMKKRRVSHPNSPFVTEVNVDFLVHNGQLDMRFVNGQHVVRIIPHANKIKYVFKNYPFESFSFSDIVSYNRSISL